MLSSLYIRLYNWVILWSPMCLFVLCEGVWGSIFHTVLTKHIFSVRLIVDAKACEQLNNKLRIGWLSHLADWSRMYHWCIYYKVSVTRLSRPTCFSLTLYPIWASYSYTQYWSISHTASISQRRPHVHNKKNSAVSLTPLSQALREVKNSKCLHQKLCEIEAIIETSKLYDNDDLSRIGNIL